MLGHRDAVSHRVEQLVADGADQPRRAGVAGQVLPAERDLVQHRDRVVAVGEPVHPGQPGRRPAQQRLQAVAGALRLGPERPVRLPPRRHVRELVGRPVAERLTGGGLRRLQQRVAALVARARDDSVDGHQQGAVVGPQREYGGVDIGAGEELFKQARIRHR